MLLDSEDIESKTIRNLIGPNAGDVLEVGCGDGRLTGVISSISDSVLALDPDPDSIQKARHLLVNGVRLMRGSGENIPLANDSVDTVVFSLSLHHHPDPENALTQAQRVLKERGRILVLEPGSESPINRCFRLIHDEDEAYERAAAAINWCGADLEDRGTFISISKFDDFGEMVEHLYSYFDFDPVQSQVKAMEKMLGSAAKDRPLVLEDSTRWWLLRETASA